MKSNLAYQPALFSNDTDSGPIAPDACMPCQFYEPSVEGPLAAEKRLMAALLSDGVEMYLSECKSGIRGLARDWVERSEGDYVFGFDSVCEALEIDPEYLRAGLIRFSEGRLSDGSIQREWKKIRRPRK